MITLIAAVAKNGVIGNNNKTPWQIPEELALFKEITMGHTVIMGQKTYESIGHALPGRQMFVLTHSPQPTPSPDLVFCSSIQDALNKTKSERSVFVAGGGSVYAQMMPLADELRISHINQEYPGDVLFPEIHPNTWKESSRTEYELFTHIHYIRT